MHRINSGSLVDAFPPSAKFIFLLGELTTPFLVQLLSLGSLLLRWIAWWWCLRKFIFAFTTRHV